MDTTLALTHVISYTSSLLLAIEEIFESKIVEAIEILDKARQDKATVWIVGNGGSAATASHLANELWKTCGIKAIAIPDLVSIVTAYGNDDGWEYMFSRTLEEKFEDGDVLVAISCSGRSLNVLEAVRTVLKRKGKVISLTGLGTDSNILAQLNTTKLCVASADIRVQEDVHMIICHMIGYALSKQE